MTQLFRKSVPVHPFKRTIAASFPVRDPGGATGIPFCMSCSIVAVCSGAGVEMTQPPSMMDARSGVLETKRVPVISLSFQTKLSDEQGPRGPLVPERRCQYNVRPFFFRAISL